MKVSTMRRLMLLTVSVFAAFALAACTPEVKPTTNVPTSQSPSPAVSPSGVNTKPSPATSPSVGTEVKPLSDASGKASVDALVGVWPGSEKSSLEITKKGDAFTIAIKKADKTENFDGKANGAGIEFTRNGKTETIKAATVEETGIKWTNGEKSCVVITKGSEGFCKK